MEGKWRGSEESRAAAVVRRAQSGGVRRHQARGGMGETLRADRRDLEELPDPGAGAVARQGQACGSHVGNGVR